MAARLVSALFWAAVVTLVVVAVEALTGDSDATPTSLRWALWAAPMVVDVVLVATKGWDPGKLALGLRVVDRRGVPPGLRAALVRSVVIDAPRLVSAVPLVAASWASWVSLPWACLLIWSMATGPDRQGWQDRAAGTWVVQRSTAGAVGRSMRDSLGDRGA